MGPVVVIGVKAGHRSVSAFWKAVRHCSASGTVFHIVHVSPKLSELSLSRGWRDTAERERRQRSALLMEQYREMAEAAGLKFLLVELEGDAAEALCTYCAAIGAGILVLGSPSSGLKKLISGGLVGYCVQNAPCAVIVDRNSTPKASGRAGSVHSLPGLQLAQAPNCSVGTPALGVPVSPMLPEAVQ